MTASLPTTNRRGFLKLVGAMGVASAFAGSLSACGTPGAQTSGGAAGKADGSITAGISYELGTNGYDPMKTTAALTLAANWHTMEGLTELNPATRETYAALGADLPKKIDDTTYEVKLRDGAVFHDGSKVTADDVVFSFTRVMDPANKSLYVAFIPFLDKVTKKDDTTVTIKTKYPFSLVAERLTVVKIVPKAAVEKDAKAFDMNPIGTGPYKMTDNGAASQKIVFEKFDKYTGKHAAKAKTMTWSIMPDDATRTNALQSGSVQAMDAVPATNLSSLASAKKVSAEQGFGLLFAMFNCGSAPMNDVRNRQAIMYALDYDKICKTGMADLAAPATCFVQQGHPAYKKAATVYPGNQAKAKELLAQTGLKKVRLLASNHGWFAAVRPMIKESLEAVGLEVAYEEKKSADVYATIDGKPEAYDIVVAPGDPSVFGDDADLLLRWWYAGKTWTEDRQHWKGQPSYDKVQALLDEAAKLTGDAQKGKWGEIFDVIAENVPLYPIFHRKSPTAWDDKTLVGFKPLKVTGLSFVDVGSTK